MSRPRLQFKHFLEAFAQQDGFRSCSSCMDISPRADLVKEGGNIKNSKA